jgi:hypothetical protein
MTPETPTRGVSENRFHEVYMSRRSDSPGGFSSPRSLASLLVDPMLSAVLDHVVPFLAVVGRITLLVAREKVGKSTLARAAAAAVSAGSTFLDQEVSQGGVLWVVLEEALADVVHKLNAFGPRAEEVWLLKPTSEDRFEEMRHAVESVKPRLVVIDTLSSYAAGEGADENASTFWTRLIGQFRSLAEENNCAVLLLHHAAKRDGGGYRGSTAIGAAVDQIIEMQETDASSVARIMSSHGRLDIPSFTVSYNRHASRFTFDGELSAENGESARLSAKRRMREFLQIYGVAGKTAITGAARIKALDGRACFEEMLTDGEIEAVSGGYALVGQMRAAA